jgi:acyl carrier protein
MNIETRIKNIIASQLGMDSKKITNKSLLAQELGADSLDTVEIIMAIEEEFGETLQDANIKITTVQDVINYVEHATQQ